MEFGGAFADDLFEAEPTQKKRQASDVEYRPKVLTPKWFEDDDSAPPEDADKIQFHVFQGDNHYYQGQWVAAADAYARALGYLASNNPCILRRLLLESLARCRVRCGDAEGAIQFGEKLLDDATSENQLFTAHGVLAYLYGAAGKTKEEIFSLQYCLDVRPQSIQHLIQLAKAHLKQLSWTYGKDKGQSSEVKATEPALKGRTVEPEETVEEKRTKSDGSQNFDQARTDSDLKTKCNSVSSIKSSDTRSENVVRSELLRDRCNICEPPECDSGQAVNRTGGVQVPVQNDGGSGENALCNNHGCGHHHLEGSMRTPDSSGRKTTEGTHAKEKEPVFVSGVEDDVRTLSLGDSAENRLQDESNGEVDGLRKVGRTEGELMFEITTYLIRAQQALKVDQLAAMSIAKKRNGELVHEVESLLQSLHLDAATLEEITEQLSEKQDD